MWNSEEKPRWQTSGPNGRGWTVALLATFATATVVGSAWTFRAHGPSVGDWRHALSSHSLPFSVKSLCDPLALDFAASDLSLACDGHRLRAGRPVRVSIPSFPTYWTGRLRHDGSDSLVPIYRSFSRADEGYFAVPFAGEWDLEIWSPETEAALGDDPEPSWCLGLMNGGQDDRLNRSTSVFPAAWDFCRPGRPSGEDFAVKAPRVKPLDEAMMVRRRLSFSGDVDPASLVRTVEEMAGSVYGDRLSTVVDRGHVGIGYWRMRSKADPAPGSVEYQPERSGCPGSFDGDGHQSVCSYEGKPTYAWQPLSRPWDRRILPGDEVASCARERRFVVVGDSIAHGVYRGLLCAASGYAGVEYPAGHLATSPNTVTMLALFAPIDLRLRLSYDDFLAFLKRHGGPSTEEERGEYVWQVGTWMTSYVPSSEWSRGLGRLGEFLKRHEEETGSEHRFTLTTAPHWDPAVMPSAGGAPWWQTLARTFAFNQLVLDLAKREGFGVVDLFGPTGARTSGSRIDDCHVCDDVNYELAHMVYSGLCHPATY